ncbi:RloB-like protein [Fluviicoccus keumensis]|uniref:RloB-like protein n=1 Tax=Fluviicoccus keumensis TaxID=1435465 RepID=A0A4Q7ZCP6_9GAMM|nr:RloB family protein [Fluviicoccus keumensis]RZU47921.1 RloB-like protein [Fluviicoccus keumensis]
MGRDNQAKERQLRRKTVREGRRAGYARILIVTEGSKTEPLYLEEIRALYQLHSANVAVQPGQLGTAPIQVVRYAQQLFEQGDLHKGIRPRSFDQVYAVFDRDDHESYFNALNLAKSLDGKLRNDEREPVRFKAIASVPSFELWLLLHYEDVRAPVHRDEVMVRLKQYMPGYDKGAGRVFAMTRDRLAVAMQRARGLAERFSEYTEPEPFTGFYELVGVLTTLRN